MFLLRNRQGFVATALQQPQVRYLNYWQLKGKPGLEVKLKKRRAKEETLGKQQVREMIENSKRIKWEPETEIEKMYKEFIEEIINTRKRFSEKKVLHFLSKVQTIEDLQWSMRVWRQLRYRQVQFSSQFTEVLMDTLQKFNETEAVHAILKNPRELRLSPSRGRVHEWLKNLIEQDQIDFAMQIFKNIAKNKFNFALTDLDYFVMIDALAKKELYDKILEAYQIKMRSWNVKDLLLPATYNAILLACQKTNNQEVLKKVEQDLEYRDKDFKIRDKLNKDLLKQE